MGMGFSISKRGELYMISQGSGGGYGDPLERDPALVIKDIEERLTTPEWAKKLYKVEFDEETLVVDEEGTKKLRDAYREQRKKQGVPYAEFVKKHVSDVPPKDIPFYGSWNSDLSTVYAGSPDDKRDPNNPGPVYFEHPKDVEIRKLEEELEAVRKKSGIEAKDKRK
tara:strand:- start:2994 stop:3494 length:501 start_codon:yes stop_codon:yes gene_type:complete